jgi:hydroxymethylpyrimidine pyrophosphatase-like HAD family hydrolase
MIIAVDFDGTLVEHKYPNIGNEVPLAFDTLKKLQSLGIRLILLTMRGGKELFEAVEYCKDRDIEFWAVNENPEQLIWTNSPKVYADLYVDDAGFGCPTRPASEEGLRAVVDWGIVQTVLLEETE